MIRTALLLIAPLIASCLLGQTTESQATIHFAVDDHRLDAEARTVIERFVKECDRTEEHSFMLLGHTDSDGGSGYNELLARNRARTVREQLIALGVAPELISSESFGERRPINANGSIEEKKQNRRVEVVFVHQRLAGLDDLQRRIGSEHITVETIDPTKDQWITGRHGTSVRFPASGLMNPDGGAVRGRVQVTITEALALNDMIAEGLSTVSDGRILVSGGMMRVDAVDAQGNPLQLNEGGQVLVSLPTSMRQQGMTLFTSSTGADWDDTRRAPIDLSRAKLPERPYCEWPAFQTPHYKADLSAKPSKPVEPARPTEPQPPRRESYKTTVRWYDMFRKSRIAARDEMRYTAAMAVYDEKLAKYEGKMNAYHADCLTWPERWSRYKTAFAEWQSDTACAREAFWRDALPQAEERYKAQVDEQRVICEERERIWRADYEVAMARYGRMLDSLGLSGARDLGSYVFSASQLGWINCDRFYDVPASQKHDVIVYDADTVEKHVYLVFTGINSMLRMGREASDRFVQYDAPRNEQAVVVAYKVVDGRAWLSKQKVERGKRMQLDFKPSSIAEVRSTIQGLRNG